LAVEFEIAVHEDEGLEVACAKDEEACDDVAELSVVDVAVKFGDLGFEVE